LPLAFLGFVVYFPTSCCSDIVLAVVSFMVLELSYGHCCQFADLNYFASVKDVGLEIN
jgi:hypothetical protein